VVGWVGIFAQYSPNPLRVFFGPDPAWTRFSRVIMVEVGQESNFNMGKAFKRPYFNLVILTS
jgi:hypothetical protein